MKIKIKSTLILLLAWVFLILSAGTITGLFAFRMGKESLSKVDKPEIIKNQSSTILSEARGSKIVDENEILMKVEKYIKIQKEALKKSNQQLKSSQPAMSFLNKGKAQVGNVAVVNTSQKGAYLLQNKN